MPFDPNSVTPGFIGANLEKQKEKWRARAIEIESRDHDDEGLVYNRHRDDIQMQPDQHQIESQRQLAVHKKENAKYWKNARANASITVRLRKPSKVPKVATTDTVTDSDISLEDSEGSMNLDTLNETDTCNKDYYENDYVDYRYVPKIQNLSQWFCHEHQAPHIGHRPFCVCGMPMVAQLCGLLIPRNFIFFVSLSSLK